jgi:hypothetical protein
LTIIPIIYGLDQPDLYSIPGQSAPIVRIAFAGIALITLLTAPSNVLIYLYGEKITGLIPKSEK